MSLKFIVLGNTKELNYNIKIKCIQIYMFLCGLFKDEFCEVKTKCQKGFRTEI